MNANAQCVTCLLDKQERIVRPFPDENKKSDFIAEVLKLLYEHAKTEPAPWLYMKIEEIYARYYEPVIDYPAIKHKYNQYMLSKESIVEEIIMNSEDPIAEGIKYACAGNFIDFGAMAEVDDSILEDLLANASENSVDADELAAFKSELSSSKELVYLTDNCGEVVMDKLFIKAIKKLYPDLHISVIVRSGIALNDANMEDAVEIGLTDLVNVVESGAACTGTVPKILTPEAKAVLDAADVVISKGQGNFEGMHGNGYNVYYMFLCKCDMYVRRFGLKRFTAVFSNEKNIRTIC